jgi:hypothetical protein
MKITLAEALLRRKELQLKVNQLSTIKEEGLFEVRSTRKPAHEGIDDVIAKVPKVSIAEVTEAFDFHSKRLRQIDALIQRANWETELEVEDTVMADYKAKAE